MTLGEWLTQQGLRPTDFARRIKKPQATVLRYVSGKRIPEPDIMKLIFEATDGAVTPNDFHQLGHMRAEACEATP